MKQQTSKHLRVTHKHRKSYRKRHYAVLIASLAFGIALVNSIILYMNNQTTSTRSATQTISDVFGPKKVSNSLVRSTYGFSLSYFLMNSLKMTITVTNCHIILLLQLMQNYL